MHLRRGLSVTSGVALLGLLAFAFIACVGQGEGERCDQARASNTDCNDGLVCIHVNGVNSDICCPEIVSERTGVCVSGTTSVTDTGTTSETSTDTGADTAADTGADTAAETSTEAGSETGADASDAAEAATDAAAAG